MRLGELRAAVEAACGNSFVIDSTRHFNTCLRLLSSKSEEVHTETITVTNGEWVIPPHVLAIHSMAVEGQTIPVRTFQPAEMLPPVAGGAIPHSRTKIGNRIVFHPRTTGTISVDVFYTMRPPLLVNDGDVPTIPDADDLLIAYAVWQVKREDEDLRVATEKGNEFYRLLGDWIHLNGKSNPVSKRISFEFW